MKDMKFGLVVLAGILGMVGAYGARQKKVNSKGTVYHAVTNGAGNFSWTTHINPLKLQCVILSNISYCTIITKSDPPYTPKDNQAPNEKKLSFFPKYHSVYTLKF